MGEEAYVVEKNRTAKETRSEDMTVVMAESRGEAKRSAEMGSTVAVRRDEMNSKEVSYYREYLTDDEQEKIGIKDEMSAALARL